jgi:hypothetical protein
MGVEASSDDLRHTSVDTVTARLMPDLHASHTAEDRIDLDMVPVLRSQSPGARLVTLDAIWRSAVTLVHAGVAAQHPDWTHEMLSAETARRMASHRA